MKKEKYPVLIYRDENFENEIRAGIKEVYNGLVSLLDIWDGLGVGECSDLWQLCTNASKMYQDAFRANVEAPSQIGKYQLNKSAFLNIIEIPVPNDLYVQARAITKMKCFGYQDCWRLQDGKVFQDEVEVEKIIHSRNIYANNESQKVLGAAVILFVQLNCFINSYFKVIPWQHMPGMPWTLTGRVYPNIADLSLEIEQLRFIISPLVGDVPPEIKTFLPADFDLEGFKKIISKL